MTKAVSLGSGEPPGRHTDIVSAARPLSPSYDPLTDRLCAAGDLHVHDRAADKCLLSIHCGPSTQLARSPMLADFGPAVLECATAASRSSLLELSTASRDRSCPEKPTVTSKPEDCSGHLSLWCNDCSRREPWGAWILARRRDTDFFSTQSTRSGSCRAGRSIRSSHFPPSPGDLTAYELPMRRASRTPGLWWALRPRWQPPNFRSPRPSEHGSRDPTHS